MRISRVAIIVAMLLQATVSSAQDTETESPTLQFNGFGTLGMARSNELQADFISNMFVPEGAGSSSRWSPKVDSRLGLQLTADSGSRLSAVVQVVMEHHHDNSFRPTVEWANLRYQVTSNLYVRAGRIIVPGLMTSEYRKIGYALPWVRPPLEVYGLQPVTNSDGIDAGYEFPAGGFTNTLRVNYGRKNVDSADGTGSTVRDLWGLSATTERGPLTLHMGYQRARLTVDSLQPLFDGFRQFGPAGEAIAERFDIDHKQVEIVGIGARYETGSWFLTGEWTRFYSRTFLGDRYGGYLTGGYRFGLLTPYLTIGEVNTKSPRSSPGLATDGLPPPLASAAMGLNAGLNELLASSREQESLSVGLRWDLVQDASLKLQYDHIDLGAQSPGFLINPQPAFRPGGSVSLVTLTLDFVF